MKKCYRFFLLVAAFAGLLAAQTSETDKPVKLGFRVGVPVTNMFDTSNTVSILSGTNLVSLFPGPSFGSFSSSVPRYEFGLSAEFRLPYRLRFEVDGLYKRGGFDNSFSFPGGGFAYNRTSFNQWEIPGLFKYHFSMGHFRPFVDLGASFRHISTIAQTTYAPVVFSPIRSDNSFSLHNRNSFGGVAGFGLTFKKGPLELTPEARYTRWANQSFTATGLRTNLDQGDVLLGITF
jgi:hypothetical protein